MATMDGLKHPGGRPTKYYPALCQDLIDFFNVEPTKETLKTITTAKGTVIEETDYVATPMPYFVDWCMKIGIHKSTMLDWVERHPEFSDAYTRAKELQERHLSQNALLGNYNANFASLTAKNWLGWKDRQEHEHTGKDGGPLAFIDMTANGDSGSES